MTMVRGTPVFILFQKLKNLKKDIHLNGVLISNCLGHIPTMENISAVVRYPNITS